MASGRLPARLLYSAQSSRSCTGTVQQMAVLRSLLIDRWSNVQAAKMQPARLLYSAQSSRSCKETHITLQYTHQHTRTAAGRLQSRLLYFAHSPRSCNQQGADRDVSVLRHTAKSSSRTTEVQPPRLSYSAHGSCSCTRLPTHKVTSLTQQKQASLL